MTNENKKSTIEEAVSDLQKIREAADKNAMKKLVKEFPKKFEALLKEELNKVSNKKESKQQEPVKGKNKESVKDNAGEINESVTDMRGMSLGEVENEFDATDNTAAFQVGEPACEVGGEEGAEGTNIELTMDDIEEELAKMEGLANNMEGQPAMGEPEMEEANNDAENKGDPFSKIKNIFNQLGEMVQEMEDQKMHEEYKNMFDTQMTETYGENYKSLGDEKCNELYEMFVAHKKGDPFKGGGAVNESEEDQPFKDKSDPSTEQGQSIAENEEVVDEMHEKVPRGATANPDKGHKTTPAGINEEDIDEKFDFQRDVVDKNKKGDDGEKKIEDDDKKEDEKEGEDVDEAMGISISAGTITPGKLGDHQGTHGRFRNQNEAFTKRMSGLIEENKKVTKELNGYKKTITKAESLVENYRSALEKYRNQLSEMAVFNTNLANVNNLFVNEELALTTEDKVKIINKFKTINTITESEKGYSEILTEMKEAKTTITENVKEKMSGSVGESSSKKIDEAIERTAYTNEHVDKIKKVMHYVEKGKRI